MKILVFAIAALGATLLATNTHRNDGSQPAAPPAPITPPPSQNPEELGAVQWLRDLDEGKTAAQRTGKPILILFQEVPGCSNCTRYGNTTLSHPLIVEAIESLFVPVCIYNNKGGKDGEALKKFGEPAWNNPVVRIVDGNLKDISPRMPNFNSTAQLLAGMLAALEQIKQPVPNYLKLLEQEFSARETGLETAVFTMFCFWSGEGALGEIEGVIETAPGFQDGKEVVRVQFDPSIVSRHKLESMSQPKGIAACSKQEGFRTDHEPKYYLSHTDYKYLPMSATQACRVNSLLGKKQNPDTWLSERQLEWLKKIQATPDKNWKNMIGRTDLARAWAEMMAV